MVALRNGVKARRCQPRPTIIRAVVEGPCKEIKCFVKLEIVKKGWVCHECGGGNDPGVASCLGVVTRNGEKGEVVVRECGHDACGLCMAKI